MNGWKVKFTAEGEDDLRALDKIIQGRVVDKIQWLAKVFPSIVPQSLSNKWKDFYKLRVGDWRVVYEIEHEGKFIVIYRIRHRKDVYKT